MKTNLRKHLLLGVFLLLSAAGFSQSVISSETFPNGFNTTGTLGNDGSFTGSLGTWTVTTSSVFNIEVNTDEFNSSPRAMRINVNSTSSSNVIGDNSATSPIVSLAFGNCQPSSASFSFQLFTDETDNSNNDYTFGVQFYNGTTWATSWSRTSNQLDDDYDENEWNLITVNLPSSYWNGNFKYRFYAIKNTTSGGASSTELWIDDAQISVVTTGPSFPNFSDATPNKTTDGGAPGGLYEVGDIYRFDNVVTAPTALYAEVKIDAISNATLTMLDNNAGGIAQRFQPQITPTSLTADKEGYVQFSITFKKVSDGSTVLLDGLRYRHFDVDGTATPDYTFREAGWVTGQSSTLTNSPTDLVNGGTSGGWTKILGELDEHDGVSSDPDVYFTAVYGPISTIQFRLGYVYDRLTSNPNNTAFAAGAREYGTEFGCFDIAQNIPLPVRFAAFNANRTIAFNVAVTWTTAMEQNSKGFNVQRNVGGEWKTIAFVFSQADGGNSSSNLSYSFKDVNQEKGITQYRIQQVDIDGNAKYSDIRAIRGEAATAKIVVYPNPSVDGKLNVVFEDNSGVKDVQVADMQGRVVKSYKGITNNILVIERLTSGFYTIKITNRNTAATSVEKVVVK